MRISKYVLILPRFSYPYGYIDIRTTLNVVDDNGHVWSFRIYWLDSILVIGDLFPPRSTISRNLSFVWRLMKGHGDIQLHTLATISVDSELDANRV